MASLCWTVPLLVTCILSMIISTMEECPDDPIDLIFGITATDVNGSLDDCLLQMNFTINLLKELDVSISGTHVSMVEISIFPHILFEFKNHATFESLEREIRQHPNKMQLIDNEGTLDLILRLGFSKTNGGRHNVKRVVLYFTKVSTVYDLRLPDAMGEQLHNRTDIEFIAIGLNDNSTTKERKKIATNDIYNFGLRSFYELPSILPDVAKLICGSAPMKQCDDAPIDLIFGITATDLNGSIDDCMLQMNFTINLLKELDVSISGTHVSMVEISVIPKFQFGFNNYTNFESLEREIPRHPNTMQMIDNERTLDLILRYGFSKSNGGRHDVKRVVLYFTKSSTFYDSRLPVEMKVKLHNSSDITFIAIGLNDTLSRRERDKIATSDSYNFGLSTFDDLQSIHLDVAKLICGSAPKKRRKCPNDWIFYNCSCYRNISLGNAGNQNCQKQNSSLAVINDVCTLFFLQENFPPARIGINSIKNGKVHWNDGSIYAPAVKSYTRGNVNLGCLNGEQNSFSCPVNVKQALCQIKGVNDCGPMICSDGTGNKGISTTRAPPPPPSSTTTSSSSKTVTSPTYTSFTAIFTHQTTKINKTKIKPGELRERIADIKSNLTLNKKKLSSHERKLESAKDDRTSSKNMGLVAGCVICIFPVLCVLSDCSNFIRRHDRFDRIYVGYY